MTDIWIKGMDEIIKLFESYRDHQVAINRAAEKRARIIPRITTAISTDAIKSTSSEIPELQRLVERKEELTEKIKLLCQKSQIELDEVERYFWLLDDKYQRVVIRHYYLRGYYMKDLESSKDMPYCLRQCWKIRNDAFLTMAKKTARLCTR
jgi:hypothetical protein